MKKIVFFDIDGTIYQYGNGVPKDTRWAIRKLRKNGNIAMICTGRTKSMIFPEILDIGFDGIIAGAGTYIEYQGREIFRDEMEEAIARDIISTMRTLDIMAIPEGIDYIYFDKEYMPKEYFPIFEIYLKEVGKNVIEVDKASKIEVSKVSGIVKNKEEVKKMKEKYPDYKVVDHKDGFIEIIPRGFSKAEGIKKVIDNIGLDRKNTYAFGDGMNDYEMLKYVNYGVVMGNAMDSFKSQIEYVTEDYDKGGIKNALERFGLI